MCILLAENRSRVRFALRTLLEEQFGLRVVGELANGQDLLTQAEAICPDLVLLSWELPGLAGVELLSLLRRACPETHVIVLSGRLGAQRAALAAGADAFVSKVAPPEQLLAAISLVERKKAKGGAQLPDREVG
jgi:two-component system invasion response regulator UvrY